MEEINIKELFKFFIAKMRVIILVTIVAVLVGAIYSLLLVEPAYEATTTLVLTGTASATGTNNQMSDGVAITQNDLNLNSKLVATYREIIKSKTVLKDVIGTLDLSYSVDALANKITVSTVSDTEMISIKVKTNDPKECALVANELANKFSEQIKEIYNIENISIIDRAEDQTVPVNVNIVKQIIIYTLIGLSIACLIVFLMFYFDTTLKDANQIEKMGLTVLTSIPEKMDERGRRK